MRRGRVIGLDPGIAEGTRADPASSAPVRRHAGECLVEEARGLAIRSASACCNRRRNASWTRSPAWSGSASRDANTRSSRWWRRKRPRSLSGSADIGKRSNIQADARILAGRLAPWNATDCRTRARRRRTTGPSRLSTSSRSWPASFTGRYATCRYSTEFSLTRRFTRWCGLTGLTSIRLRCTIGLNRSRN